LPIRITLDAVLARRNMTAREVAARIAISETQMSLFRSGKVRGLRFSTLARMCAVLRCLPGDLIDYEPDPTDLPPETTEEPQEI
jgi:putative transcriptional regulator